MPLRVGCLAALHNRRFAHPRSHRRWTVCSGADEPATLARLVRTRRSPGAPWRAQAVLARTNNQLQPLRDELLAKGIPVVTKPRSDLLRQPEVSAVVKRWHTEEPLEEASARARAVRRDQIDSNREAHPMRHPSPSDNPAGVDHSSLPASSMAAGESQSAHPVDTFPGFGRRSSGAQPQGHGVHLPKRPPPR